MPYAPVKVGYNATHDLITFSWDMCRPLFPDQNIFDSPTSIFNHFHKKSVLRSETYPVYKCFCVVSPKWGFLEGNFFVCWKCHARFRSAFFHIKSWCRKTLHV